MKVLLVTILACLLLGCSKPQKVPYLLIKPDAKIEGPVQLFRLGDEYEFFDEAVLEEESFHYAFRKDSIPESVYELRIQEKKVATLIISSGMPFSISGDFSIDRLNFEVKGNDETKALWKCHDFVEDLNTQISSIVSNIPDSMVSRNYWAVRDSVYRLIDKQLSSASQQVEKITNKHLTTLLPLMTLQLKAGNHWIFTPDKHAERINEYTNQLNKQYSHYQAVQKLQQQVDSLMQRNLFESKSKAGRRLPTLLVPNAWDQVMNLDSLIQQPSLVVLWQSDDKASRQLTKQLMRWSRSYRQQGLQLLMISLDDNKEEWLRAIKEDRLAVLHLSDLKGMQSPVLNDLGLSQVPKLLLLDKNKMIVKRGTELEELSQSVQQLIKN
ncbi:thioredoxin family protein [Carboxylicivirga sp. M1479]|uniref:thioredoxin family protein n=1 Tax=Carboxylicivirga sp. M1479 TaxID=2594476 RepID=UPI001177D7FC|nr:thioredoxin family protein [Carboxylicivirga sp. M1479]TRX72693.1 TlpA family protein disulfide reductase [Carboxylicivirga sp. M1479]